MVQCVGFIFFFHHLSTSPVVEKTVAFHLSVLEKNKKKQGPEPNQSLSENFAAMTTGSDDGDRAGSGTLGPVQGPARPAGLRGSAAAVSEDVLRMKPTHLRVHRPSGPRGTPAATAAAAAARAGFGGAVGARGRVSTSEKVPFSVPRPAGSTFLTPRSARAGAGVSSSRLVFAYFVELHKIAQSGPVVLAIFYVIRRFVWVCTPNPALLCHPCHSMLGTRIVPPKWY